MAKIRSALEEIWFVTWSCGHRALIEETLPLTTWDNVLVVDYSCPEDTGDWVEQNTEAEVLHVDASHLIDGSPIVSRARALNAALRHLSGSWVLLGDPQLYATDSTRDAVLQAASCHGSDTLIVSESPVPAALGLVAAHSETLLELGGFLPAYIGHGAESADLRLRASLGGVTIVPCDVPIGVATGRKVKFFGSQSLLEGRFGYLTGQRASMLAGVDRPRAKLLGLLL